MIHSHHQDHESHQHQLTQPWQDGQVPWSNYSCTHSDPRVLPPELPGLMRSYIQARVQYSRVQYTQVLVTEGSSKGAGDIHQHQGRVWLSPQLPVLPCLDGPSPAAPCHSRPTQQGLLDPQLESWVWCPTMVR